MAWVRTATSLISFGFAIYKFFEYLRESQRHHKHRTTRVAVVMIGIGITAMVLATIGHRRSMRALRAEYGIIPSPLHCVAGDWIWASFCSSPSCSDLAGNASPS